MAKFNKAVSVILVFCIILLIGSVVLKKMYPLHYIDIIKENADKYGLDPLFVISVVHAESRFSAEATSHKNAKGLMQIKEDTAKWCAEAVKLKEFTAEKIYQPETNIMLGVWYLHYLLDEFGGDYNLCLAAYNAGMGNVKRWLDNPKYSSDGQKLDKIPYAETERYIKKVFNNYAIYKMLYGRNGQ